MNKYFFLLLFFSLSCSLYLNFEDNPDDIKIFSPQKKQTYCQDSKKENTVVGTDRFLVDDFNRFLKDNAEKRKLEFIDKVVLWALLQMNLRPDISTPSARLQAWVLHRRKGRYWDFYVRPKKEMDGYPYFYGLENLLSFYKSKYNLSGLAAILEKYYKYQFYVNHELAETLIEKKKEFVKNKFLKKAFFKADWPLQQGETLKKLPFSKLVKEYKNKKKKDDYKINDYLFPYHPIKKVEGLEVFCNKDLNLYKHFTYLADKKKYPSSTFAFEDEKGNMFLGYASQDREGSRNFGDSFLLRGKPADRAAAFCRISFEGKKIFLISTEGKDPGQYLFQLIEKKIHKYDDFQKIDETLRSARRYYLLNPLRILYESERGSEEELDEILASGIPVYHGKKLGHIWMYGDLPNNVRGFILEARAKWELSCLKGKL